MKVLNVLLLVTPSSPGRFKGISDFARTHQWHLTVADRLTHSLDGWTGDGALVTLRDGGETLRQVRSLGSKGIPVVDLTLARPEIPLPRVAGDNPAIGRIAAEHFKSRHFRNTAWFSTGWGHQHNLRFEAFSSAMSSPPGKWAWELAPSRTKSDDWKSLSRWLSGLLASSAKPLGVFAFDDADASRVESAALAAGLSIPDDVAILGAGDDEPLCESQIVALSSVRHDLRRIGYEGAALLHRLMNGETPAEGAVLVPPCGITERASTDTLALSTETGRKARDIYAKELVNPPSTEMLAARLGVSRATLDRTIASDIGLSPAKLLSRMRLDEAKRLLKSGEYSISEIAYKTGYCNPAYFVNTFRAETGLTPRSWRESFRKKEIPRLPCGRRTGV